MCVYEERERERNSKHCFTTSFMPESDALSVCPCVSVGLYVLMMISDVCAVIFGSYRYFHVRVLV